MEVLFELKRIGSIVRVTAVDPVTGIEAVIQGPAHLSQQELQRTAARKLEFLLQKEKERRGR
ncbi:MAG: hypothetical protein EOM37_03715 [Proteobacteria bacterium]|jgi:hypothetical protein|nr:hypothetical protein [Alphaproteobacteria bacterium]NCC03144.1 hypothetical protein [Pseudomonadota bacterium]